MNKNKIRQLLEIHFKCDCLACEKYNKDKSQCKYQSECEVAQSYFRILDELDKNGKQSIR